MKEIDVLLKEDEEYAKSTFIKIIKYLRKRAYDAEAHCHRLDDNGDDEGQGTEYLQYMDDCHQTADGLINLLKMLGVELLNIQELEVLS